MGKAQDRLGLYIPGYRNNAVIQLIFFCGVTYIMLAISWSIIMIVNSEESLFRTAFLPNIGLASPSWAHRLRWWTFLTYGWFQMPNSFFELLSNMFWLYCFGSVVQMLIGQRQVMPLYAYSLFAGGMAYLLFVALLPGLAAPALVLGPRAGLLGMAVAAFTLTPNYRFYLSETFSIPIVLVAGVFAALMLIGTGFNLPLMVLCVAGGLAGFAYVKLLKAGYRPGDWPYTVMEKLEQSVAPREPNRQARTIAFPRTQKQGRSVFATADKITERRVDEILDKINQKGYNSLTKEERELLLRAGKD